MAPGLNESPFSKILSPKARFYTVETPLDATQARALVDSGVVLPESLKKAVAKRQGEFLGGRFCAQQALAQLGHPAMAAAIGIGEDYAPLWPPGFVGSITHTRGIVAAAVAKADSRAGIGIDVEALIPEEKAVNLASHILTDQEWVRFQSDASFSVSELVSLVFSAKESVYKCLRPLTGKYFGFQSAQLVYLDRDSGEFQVSLLKAIGGGFEAGWNASGRFTFDHGRIHTAFELPASGVQVEMGSQHKS